MPEPGVPESFKVLIKELQSLGLDVKVLSENDKEIEIREMDDDVSETAKELGIDIHTPERPEAVSKDRNAEEEEEVDEVEDGFIDFEHDFEEIDDDDDDLEID